MRTYLALVLGAYLVHGQVDVSSSTIDTITSSTSISSSLSLTTSSSVSTPSSLSEQTTSSSVPVDTPTISITPTLSQDTLITSTTQSGQSSSTSISEDDDEIEITTTGSIPSENTAMPELLGSEIERRELTPQESVDVTALDLETYADLLTNGAMPVKDSQEQDDAVALPACPVSGSAVEKRQIFSSRPKRPKFYPCTPTTLDVEVIYRYVQGNQKNASEKAILSRRVQKNHAYFVQVMAEYGITLSGDTSLKFTKATTAAKDFTINYFSESNAPEAKARKQRLLNYRKKTRTGGPETLNVWIVDTIENDEPGTRTNGYAEYPESRQFNSDGIVLNIAALRFDDDKLAASEPRYRGVTLIHEFGHWMGLPHTFGDSDCGKDDGIADTWQTSDMKPEINHDYQFICKRPDLDAKWIYNYMSYSTVRGTYKDKPSSIYLRAFTKGQRAVMFSRFFAFRRGLIYRNQFCDEVKRRDLNADHHALARRAEDKAKVLADLLLANCSVAIQDVYQEDTIPLPSSVLASYSTAASIRAANPTSNSNPFAPQTASIGTGTSVEAATGTGMSSSGGKATGSGKPSLGVTLKVDGRVIALTAVLCLFFAL